VLLCLVMVSLRSLIDVNTFPNATTFPPYSVDTLPYSKSPFLLLTNGLAYTPDTPITKNIMTGVAQSLSFLSKYG